jgi:hypothetical protein
MGRSPSKKSNPSVICGTDFSPATAVSTMMGIPLEQVHARIIRAYPSMDEDIGSRVAGKLELPYEAISAGPGDHRIVTTLCPGGKERMRRRNSVVQSGRFDPTMLMIHKSSLEDIKDGYELFGNREDGVFNSLITP